MLSQTQDLPHDLAPLIRSLEHAIASDRLSELAETLSPFVAQGVLDRPEYYSAPRPDRYSRRLVWQDPADRFILVGMTWGPGQVAGLHDHAGLWGAEIVVDGTMSEVQHHLVERDGESRYRFTRTLDRDLPAGSIGVVIPPLEYHEYGNRGAVVARTLHIYGGNLTTSQAFINEGDWWRAKRVDLRYDG